MQDNEEWMSGMYAVNEKVNHILLRFLPFYQRPMAFSVRHHSFALSICAVVAGKGA